MSLNKIETEEYVFELNDDDYSYIFDLLERLTDICYLKAKTPSPTVEISLEDAKKLQQSIERICNYPACVSEKMFGSMAPIEAIPKAESKWNTSESVIKWANDGLGENLRQPLNKPALPIQDQVNELRGEISELKDTISQLQSVIEGMKPNLNNARG